MVFWQGSIGAPNGFFFFSHSLPLFFLIFFDTNQPFFLFCTNI